MFRWPALNCSACRVTMWHRTLREAMIQLKRAYDTAERADGVRYLVERLWPRGLKKEQLRLDGWLKDVAPSAELRKWFSHDPAKWPEFRRRYLAELDRSSEAWRPILDAARRGRVTLIYSSHDTEHNNAVALKDYLGTKLNAPRRPGAGKKAA
jgi:uncharacterized protein YeaO (DUF488 family)